MTGTCGLSLRHPPCNRAREYKPRIGYASSTGIPFTGALHRDFDGCRCWNISTIGETGPPPNTSANEICVGGRSDPTASTDVFRNRFEVVGGTIGGIGPAVPFGTNLSGTDLNLEGGGSTGTRTPGSIQFLIGATGSSGTTPNSGSKVWRIDGAAGNFLASTDNANDIGASGANRPRNAYFGASLTVPRSAAISFRQLGGSCSMSSATTCTFSITASFTSPLCFASQSGTAATPVAAECSVSGTTVTITAASSNINLSGIRLRESN